MMRLRRPHVFVLLPVLVLAIAAPVAVIHAQAKRPVRTRNQPQEHGIINFHTNVGAFKILGVADVPAQGTLDMSFEGTVMVSGPAQDATVVPYGEVALELDRSDRGRRVYFGKGRLVVSGDYRAIQFFGRGLKAKWTGFGVLRLYGEFDQNLETGQVWYEGQEKQSWNTGGFMFQNPQPRNLRPLMPKVKPLSGG